jgi:hypothetical protein
MGYCRLPLITSISPFVSFFVEKLLTHLLFLKIWTSDQCINNDQLSPFFLKISPELFYLNFSSSMIANYSMNLIIYVFMNRRETQTVKTIRDSFYRLMLMAGQEE